METNSWAVVMESVFVPLNQNASSHYGIPCKIIKINEDICELSSPLMKYFGKSVKFSAPKCQLIKISEEEANRYLRIAENSELCKRIKEETK